MSKKPQSPTKNPAADAQAAAATASPSKKKKKKRIVSELQSQVLTEEQVQMYMDALLERHIENSEFKTEIRESIPPELQNRYFERFKTALQRSYGNPDLIHHFYETKAWFETEEWRDECQRWKLKLQQEQVFGESEGFDPSIHDLTEDGTIIKRDDID